MALKNRQYKTVVLSRQRVSAGESRRALLRQGQCQTYKRPSTVAAALRLLLRATAPNQSSAYSRQLLSIWSALRTIASNSTRPEPPGGDAMYKSR